MSQRMQETAQVVVSPKTRHPYMQLYRDNLRYETVKDAELVIEDGQALFYISHNCIDYYKIPYAPATRSTYNPVGKQFDNVICYLRFAKL